MSLIAVLAPALLPAIIDAAKSLFGGLGRRIGGLSVDDEVKLQNADMERLKALAALDTPTGVPSQWVVDLRSSFRYVAACLSILAGCYLAYNFAAVPDVLELAGNLIGAPFAFIFGERLYMGMRGIKK
jgi:hypothetical protein